MKRTAWTWGVTVMIVSGALFTSAFTLELLELRQWSLPFTIAGIVTVIAGILLANSKLPKNEKRASKYGNARTTGTPFGWMAFLAILLYIAVRVLTT